MSDDFELDWDEVSGRNDPEQRYRLYRRHNTDEWPFLLATCGTEEAVGVTLCRLAREGEFDDCAIGVLDNMGEVGKRWLIVPWLPKKP